MFIALANFCGDPDLAMAMTECMLPQWFQLAEALAPVALPDGVEGLTVSFADGLPRSHFAQSRRGKFHSTITGIDKQHFLTKATATERRDYLFDFVAESLERVDWSPESRQRVAEIFRQWRATLPAASSLSH
jgi:hypothetical protein